MSGNVSQDDDQSQKSSEPSTKDSDFSNEDGEDWDRVGCSLFSNDTGSSKFSDFNDSTNSSEVVKAVIDFDECSEKLPDYLQSIHDIIQTEKKEEEKLKQEEEENKKIEEKQTEIKKIEEIPQIEIMCFNCVSLNKIKESLNLTKEEDEKSMNEIETKLKELKIDEEPKNKVDEDGDVKCVSNQSLKNDFQNELGVNLKKIEILSDIEYKTIKDGCKLEELKEQFSSPI